MDAQRLTARAGKGTDEFPTFSETHSYGQGTTKVVRIAMNGVLSRNTESSLFASVNPLRNAIRQIRAARQDPKVAGIILEVDSPGGELTAADEFYDELLRFRQSREDRRVLVLVHGMAASGGYYIALPADHIMAQPTAIIGSIGVILQSFNLKELGDRIGVKDTTIKSGAHKDLLNPLREPDAEELALLQDNIDAMYARFLQLIYAHRNIPMEQLRQLADGRIFTAEQAKDANLVDAIGYWPDALAACARLLRVEDLYVVTYRANTGFFEMMFQPMEALLHHIQMQFPMQPKMQALWQP